jgi:hypothetical protein
MRLGGGWREAFEAKGRGAEGRLKGGLTIGTDGQGTYVTLTGDHFFGNWVKGKREGQVC